MLQSKQSLLHVHMTIPTIPVSLDAMVCDAMCFIDQMQRFLGYPCESVQFGSWLDPHGFLLCGHLYWDVSPNIKQSLHIDVPNVIYCRIQNLVHMDVHRPTDCAPGMTRCVSLDGALCAVMWLLNLMQELSG